MQRKRRHRRSRKTPRSFNFVPRAPRNWEHARRARCREFSFRLAVDGGPVYACPCAGRPTMVDSRCDDTSGGDRGRGCGWVRRGAASSEGEGEEAQRCTGDVGWRAKGMAIPRAALPCIERAHVSLMQPDKYLSIT